MLPWPNRELAWIILEESYILSIGVLPQRQRNGIGRYLIEAVIRAVRIVDGVAVTLEVAEDSLGAKALYTNVGFEVVGRRAGCYLRAANVKVAELLMRHAIVG